MKVNVFNSKMVLYGDSLETVAKYLGISRQTLDMKLSGGSEFKQDEIKKLIARWNLTPEEVTEIFFN